MAHMYQHPTPHVLGGGGVAAIANEADFALADPDTSHWTPETLPIPDQPGFVLQGDHDQAPNCVWR
jgi:hypothetical protein